MKNDEIEEGTWKKTENQIPTIPRPDPPPSQNKDFISNTEKTFQVKDKKSINDDEMLFSKKYLLGELARWSINQSPFYVPENLEIVLRQVSDLLPTYEFNTDGYKFIKKNEFHKWFFNIITQIPEVIKWNEPKNGNKTLFVFCSRYDRPKPEDDIVDLSALVNNVKLQLIKDCYE